MRGWELIHGAPADRADMIASFERIAGLVAGRLGELVTAVRDPDPAAAVAVAGKRIAWASSHVAAPAIAAGTAVPVAMAQYRGDPFYRAMIVGRAESAGIAWPDNARGARMLFGPETMLAFWISPTAALRRKGIDPLTFFRAERVADFAGIVDRVLCGEADFGCTYDRALRGRLAVGDLAPDAFTIVWSSDPLPYDTILAPPTTDGVTMSRVRNALLAISTSDELAAMPAGMTGFSYAMASDYAGLIALGEGA